MEVMHLHPEEAARLTGLRPSLFSRIEEGRVTSLSTKQFNAFRRGLYKKTVNLFLTKGNVSSRKAREYARQLPSIKVVEKAAEQTAWGKNIEPSFNAAKNIEKFEKRKKASLLKKQMERLAFEKDQYQYFAEILVQNNRFAKQWIEEGKKFINSDKVVRTKEDAIELMKEIMALGRKDGKDWDSYIVERHTGVKWKPTETKYSTHEKKYVRTFVPEGNPKYNDWVRRLRSGRIADLDWQYHEHEQDDEEEDEDIEEDD
jgi:hypothetical protein